MTTQHLFTVLTLIPGVCRLKVGNRRIRVDTLAHALVLQITPLIFKRREMVSKVKKLKGPRTANATGPVQSRRPHPPLVFYEPNEILDDRAEFMVCYNG